MSLLGRYIRTSALSVVAIFIVGAVGYPVYANTDVVKIYDLQKPHMRIYKVCNEGLSQMAIPDAVTPIERRACGCMARVMGHELGRRDIKVAEIALKDLLGRFDGATLNDIRDRNLPPVDWNVVANRIRSSGFASQTTGDSLRQASKAITPCTDGTFLKPGFAKRMAALPLHPDHPKTRRDWQDYATSE